METPIPIPTPYDITELGKAAYPVIYIAGWVFLTLILFVVGNLLYRKFRNTKKKTPPIHLSEKLISRSSEISTDPQATIESLKSALAMTFQSSVRDKIDQELYKKIVFCLYQPSPDKELLRNTLTDLLKVRSV